MTLYGENKIPNMKTNNAEEKIAVMEGKVDPVFKIAAPSCFWYWKYQLSKLKKSKIIFSVASDASPELISFFCLGQHICI